jgi:hypothetical protein
MHADIEDARDRLVAAARALTRIENLPTRVGAVVKWDNGVVWTRFGGDEWLPNGETDTNRSAPSSHVAHLNYEVMAP